MKRGFTIKQKLMWMVLGLVVPVFALVMGFIIFQLGGANVKKERERITIFTQEKALSVSKGLNEDMAVARTMAETLSHMATLPDSLRDALQHEMLAEVLRDNRQYNATWLSWELSAIDPTWPNDYGRQRSTYFVEGNQVVVKRDSMNLDGDTEGIYFRTKQNKREEISEPYFYNNYLNNDEKTLGTSVCAPVVRNSEFLGLTGTDISLSNYRSLTEVDAYNDSYAILLANNGAIVAHPDSALINQNFNVLGLAADNDMDMLAGIKQGLKHTFKAKTEGGTRVLVNLAPIPIGRSNKPWSVVVVVPQAELTRRYYRVLLVSIAIGLLGMGALGVVVWRTTWNISDRVQRANRRLKTIAKGAIDEAKEIKVKRNDELGEMAQSLNTMMERLRGKATFAQEIGQGNLDANLDVNVNEDTLGRSMLEMRDNLQAAREKEVKRQWVAEGLASFNDLLRDRNEDISEYASRVVGEIVRYLDITQGAIFLTAENETGETVLKLSGAYAYERRKFLDREIYPGDGLLGQCYLEKQRIRLTEIPQDYLTVTSGLGEANPHYLLLQPMIYNEVVYGIVELAAFRILEAHELDFVASLCETLASVVASLRINQQTKTLLAQASDQASRLQSQEEEMRQQVEEMESTQEEMQRAQRELTTKESNMRSLIDNTSDTVCLLDSQYRVQVVNKALLDRYKGTQFERLKEGDNILEMLGEHRDYWYDYYSKAMAGEHLNFTIKSALANEQQQWRQYHINPIYDSHDQIDGISIVARDITEQMQARIRLEEKEHTLNALINSHTDTFFAIDKDYKVTVMNQLLIERYRDMGITLRLGDNILEMLSGERLQKWQPIYAKAMTGEKKRMTNKKTDDTGNERQTEVFVGPIHNTMKEIIGVYVIGRAMEVGAEEE